MARFTTLYSGSSGNCAVVAQGNRYVLIDIGKSCRQTLTALKQVGLSIADCCGIFITHEHTDHVAGLGTLLRNYDIPVFARIDTLQHLEQADILPPAAEAQAVDSRDVEIDGFTVSAFPTCHDVPCCGYRITAPDGHRMAIATDLGVLTTIVQYNLSGCNLVALEANYDRAMLQNGPYPYFLKVRIESDHGHLDNYACASEILDLVQEGCRNFSLCHLSQVNNTPQLALKAVKEILSIAKITPPPGEPVHIQTQPRNEPAAWVAF